MSRGGFLVGGTEEANPVGRNVNVTGRIETYSVGGQVLISETTHARLRDDAVCSDSLVMEGKGLGSPIKLYNVSALRSEGLELSDEGEKLQTLTRPLSVTMTQLDGKHLTADVTGGSITRLSRAAAEISAEMRIPLWSNLKIHFGESDQDDGVYAKVVKYGEDQRGTFSVRFTSSSASLDRVIEELGLHTATES